MTINPVYTEITPYIHEPVAPPGPGSLQNITKDVLDDDRYIVFEELEIDGTASGNYSESRSFSISIPELRDYTPDHKPLIRRIHGKLPKGIDAGIGVESAHAGDSLSPGTADILTPLGAGNFEWNTHLVDYRNPFGLMVNAVDNIVGVLKVQLKTSAIVSASDYALESGLANFVLYKIDIPYSLGNISGRSPATGIESVGTGSTFVLVRPANYDPANPPAWEKVGCLRSEVEEVLNREYGDSMKGRKNNIVSKSITKDTTDLNINASSDSPYFRWLGSGGGNIQSAGWRTEVRPNSTGVVAEYEVLLETHSDKGQLRWLRIPRAFPDPAGTITHGGTEYQIPLKFEGGEAGIPSYTNNLYQSLWVALGVNVTV
jgi:hypothetical protein